MGRKTIWKEPELDEMHNKVLSVLEDADSTNAEIAQVLTERFPNEPEIQKWNGHVGDVARYVVARRLTFLRNRNYVETGLEGKWKLVRKTPLRNEVIRAKSTEWELAPEDTVYRLLDEYIEKDKEKWIEYVKRSNESEKKLKELASKLEEARTKLKEASPI